PVAGASLLRVINTRALILLDQASGRYYLYLSDRWVRAPSLQGPWSPASNPPASLDQVRQTEVGAQQVDLLNNLSPQVTDALSKGNMPATHPAGDALPGVPGTPQAQQAVIEQSIPQTATVRRDAARLTVTYDGKPQFARIEGTSLQRALNTPTPVIRVNGHSYYACD